MTANDRLPARTLPLIFLGTAHVSLALAFLFAACWPRAVAGFFYHSWLIGLVHLITLGWISFSIIGAFFIVGPLALRLEMPARRLDYVAYAVSTLGLAGMVGHFWIQQYEGMAWSASTVASGVLYMTGRIFVNVRRAKIHRAVKLHIQLAIMNFWIAASMGLLIAVDKVTHVLPGFSLSHVFAHAHLAAIGWATMMVIGVGYRMLPMTFPSKMPETRFLYASAALLETGVLGLFVTLLLQSSAAIVFSVAIVLGIACFVGHVVWMRHHRVSKPAGSPVVDFGILHAASAGLCLIVAAVTGLVLVAVPMSPLTLRAAAAYGVIGLLGFLSQMVVAMEARLLPMVAWFWAYSASDFKVPPPSPLTMRDRTLQAIVFGAWTIGIPALASGMFLESAGLVALGAWSLLTAVTIGGLDNALVVIQSRPARTLTWRPDESTATPYQAPPMSRPQEPRTQTLAG